MKIIFTFVTALIALTSSSVNAQIKPADVDNIIAEEMIRQNLPGLAVGVYQQGKINYAKGYGYSDINNRKPIKTSTSFRWASISKTITAIAAFQVEEKYSDFSINDKVIKHYPYWTSNFKEGSKSFNITKPVTDKERKKRITIEQLLTHKSGINHYRKGVSYNKGKYISDDDNFNANSSTDVFRNLTLDSDPGSKYNYKYTTYGFNLLGAIIDKKTGSYTDWVTRNIKNKLGLYTLKVANGSMYGIRKPKDGILEKGPDGDKEYVLPGGGWESNILDLLKFARGINDGKLLKNTSNLWKDDGNKVKTKKGKIIPQIYKRGIYSTGTGNELRVWHGGTHGNLKTHMYIMPKKNISIVVMIPVQYADPWNIVRKIVHKMGTDRSSSIKKGSKDKCGAGMGSTNRKFVGVWRKTNDDVIIRHGYTSTNFNSEWKFLSSKGYHLENFEFTNNLWNGVFKKGTGKYAMWRNYDQAGFNTKWKEMNRKGYRLYDLETYTIQGKRKWAGLFKKSSEKYAMFRNFSTSAFADKRKEMAKGGLKLIDIEVYNSGGQLKWSGVWVAGKDGMLNRNYAYADFKKLIQKRTESGYNLIDVEVYKVNGIQKWAGIWEKNTEAQKVSFGLNYCKFMDKHSEYNDDKFELLDLKSY